MQRHRRPTAYAQARAELEHHWRVDVGHIEGLACEAHAHTCMVDPFDPESGEALAARHGYLVLRSPTAVCGGGCLLPGMLTVRPTPCDQLWNLRILHELAHLLLGEHYPQHNHADVWALTLALAVPRGTLRRIGEARHVPPWALRLRRQTARAVPRAA